MQVYSAVVRKPARTWGRRGVVHPALALVHSDGALHPLSFANVDLTLSELEHLAALITAFVHKTRPGGHSGGNGVHDGEIAHAKSSPTAADSSSPQQQHGTPERIDLENDMEVPLLTDIYRTPAFPIFPSSGAASGYPHNPMSASAAAAGSLDLPHRQQAHEHAGTASAPTASCAAQQKEVLAQLSAWDSEGAALLRSVPRLVGQRVKGSTDENGTFHLKIRPTVAVSNLKLAIWAAAFVLTVVRCCSAGARPGAHVARGACLALHAAASVSRICGCSGALLLQCSLPVMRTLAPNTRVLHWANAYIIIIVVLA